MSQHTWLPYIVVVHGLIAMFEKLMGFLLNVLCFALDVWCHSSSIHCRSNPCLRLCSAQYVARFDLVLTIAARSLPCTFFRMYFTLPADAFDYLDAPVERVSGADVPMPYAENLEKSALPQVDQILASVLKSAGKA